MLSVSNLDYASFSTVFFQRLSVIISEGLYFYAVVRYNLLWSLSTYPSYLQWKDSEATVSKVARDTADARGGARLPEPGPHHRRPYLCSGLRRVLHEQVINLSLSFSRFVRREQRHSLPVQRLPDGPLPPVGDPDSRGPRAARRHSVRGHSER